MKALKICALLVAAPFAPFLFLLAGHLFTYVAGPFVLGCMAYGLFMFFRYRIKHGKWYRTPSGLSRPNINILETPVRQKYEKVWSGEFSKGIRW